ncbi:hypothetical protein GRX03_09705 [Halovenus sp. WSH3]|uniref:Uncharacterized protein n=1 Tax=Halovenus carboxidivorans TaxID=2692199 RepID=A0A6B0T111_9EURY|nr:hypothetical protein [Halovenus carboxidivorans]MXR51878.1 hypothetical protein [Halovenus carboxidivorans]
MRERRSDSETSDRDQPSERPGSTMHARRWAIAATREPSAYDIPELPAWRRPETAEGIAFASEKSTESFISAREPMTVRR